MVSIRTMFIGICIFVISAVAGSIYLNSRIGRTDSHTAATNTPKPRPKVQTQIIDGHEVPVAPVTKF